MKYVLYALHRGENAEPNRIKDSASAAEKAGFEALWVGDHITLPRDAPDPFDEPRLEAVSTLAYLAAATSRIRLGVAVLVLPQRQPVLLAKQLATLDVLSEGRLTVGVGVGHVASELAAMGVNVADRGAMTEEFLGVLRAVWSQQDWYHGRWITFDGVLQYPAPVQRPHPPIVIGGHVPAALERAARIGDGWFGWELSVADTREAVRTLRELRRRYAADRHESLEISIVPDVPLTPEMAQRYADVGVDRLVLVPPVMTVAETDALIDRAATELIPATESGAPVD